MSSFLLKKFKDIAIYSPAAKTAISVRDGVIEYEGSELMIEPYDKIFTVYRSPATIANAAVQMLGIPLTDEHVSLDEPAPDTGSVVVDASMIDSIDASTRTRVAIKNKLSMNDELSLTLQKKSQLSLGYFGDLVPHDEFDFEQINLVPHHLAAVSTGRCGELCSFLDRKPDFKKKEQKEMVYHKAFVDAEGQVSLEQVVEIATSLPEAIKMLSLEDLQKIMPSLQEIIGMATVKEVAVEDEETPPEKGETIPKVETTDEETEGKEEEKDEEKPKFSDADFRIALKEKSQKFADEAVKQYAQVVDKARNFLDESYDFKDKKSEQIMKDALSTESNEAFSDVELPLAFKLLKKTAEYKKFGDHKTVHILDEIADKEL